MKSNKKFYQNKEWMYNEIVILKKSFIQLSKELNTNQATISRWAKSFGIKGLFDKTAEEHFWEKVNKNGTVPKSCPELGKCWLWTGSKGKRGHGRIRVGKKGDFAHRVSFVIHYGSIPNGKMICHKCNVACCVNPKHLYIGNHKSNTEDSINAGTFVKSVILSNGEDNINAKLTNEKVIEIRKLYSKGNISQYELANRFGVTQPTINDVILNKIWRHV